MERHDPSRAIAVTDSLTISRADLVTHNDGGGVIFVYETEVIGEC